MDSRKIRLKMIEWLHYVSNNLNDEKLTNIRILKFIKNHSIFISLCIVFIGLLIIFYSNHDIKKNNVISINSRYDSIGEILTDNEPMMFDTKNSYYPQILTDIFIEYKEPVMRGDIVKIKKVCTTVILQDDFIKNDSIYLFSWDNIPGNDNVRLIEYLNLIFGIEWVKSAKFEKIDNGKTIKISTENNSLSLRLDDNKTKVDVKTEDGRRDEFIAKMENDRLNIYSSIKGIDSIDSLDMIILQLYGASLEGNKSDDDSIISTTVLNLKNLPIWKTSKNSSWFMNCEDTNNYILNDMRFIKENSAGEYEIHYLMNYYYNNQSLLILGKGSLSSPIRGANPVEEMNINFNKSILLLTGLLIIFGSFPFCLSIKELLQKK